jgi:hypothetical protein
VPGDTGYHAVRPKGRWRLPSGRTDFYAYSFTCTNVDVSTPDKAVATERWYRRRTTVRADPCRLPGDGPSVRRVTIVWVESGRVPVTMDPSVPLLPAPRGGTDLVIVAELLGHARLDTTRSGRQLVR